MNIKGKKQAMHTKFTSGLIYPQTERRGFTGVQNTNSKANDELK